MRLGRRRSRYRDGDEVVGDEASVVPWPYSSDAPMTDLTDQALLAELRAKREWLRSNPGGATAAMTRRKVKEMEREAADRGLDPEVSPRSRSETGLTAWYVVEAKTSTRRSLHRDRACMHLADSVVREATELERDQLAICSTCS